MGYLLNQTVNNYKQIVDERLKLDWSEYTKFLSNPPMIVNWYSQNLAISMANTGLQHPEHLLGTESPIKYTKYCDVPLFGVSETNLQLDSKEYGLDVEFSSNGVIVPGTIKPLMNDYFIITYMSKNYLFRVTSVQQDTIKSNNYYQVEFSFFKVMATLDEIEQNVTKTMTIIYDNISSKYKSSVIVNDEIPIYEQCLSTMNMLCEQYKSYFYYKQFNFFGMDFEGSLLMDSFVIEFIKQMKFFTSEYGCKDPLIVDPMYDNERTFGHVYINSFWGMLENFENITNFNPWNIGIAAFMNPLHITWDSPLYYYQSYFDRCFKMELFKTSKFLPQSVNTSSPLPKYYTMSEKTFDIRGKKISTPIYKDFINPYGTPASPLEEELSKIPIIVPSSSNGKPIPIEDTLFNNTELTHANTQSYVQEFEIMQDLSFSTYFNYVPELLLNAINTKTALTVPTDAIDVEILVYEAYNILISSLQGNILTAENLEFIGSLSSQFNNFYNINYNDYSFGSMADINSFYILPLMMYSIKLTIDNIINTIPTLNI